jgi:hypothetical protein
VKAFLALFQSEDWEYDLLTRAVTFRGTTFGPGWVMRRTVGGEMQYRDMSRDEADELNTFR